MRITLGVTGGIAAYKSAELVRRLQGEGHTIQVVMTRAAREFITPLTFAALSGQRVITDLFTNEPGGSASLESAIDHIAVAQRTDLLLVAPATADILAKFARGVADDFLSTLYLACTAPVVVAPAMNVNMWQHAATQDNVSILRARGVHIVEPSEGYLACGMIGSGRLAELDAMLQGVRDVTKGLQDLSGESVLVTAGPTHENIDPVRYLTNRSSGKMGYAVAAAAAKRGAKVVLVSGPTALPVPEGVERFAVRSAMEMLEAVRMKFAASTIAIFAAAVADYRAASPASQKIKRTAEPFTLTLEPNPDILATIAREKGDRLVIGFAAETENVAENARKKLAQKNADLIVANDVSAEGAGFDGETNIVTLFSRDSRDLPLARMSKTEVAHRILDEALRLRGVLRSKPASQRAGD
ncbi:MAG TPA: bifunctional phosphopantothenoylcysteine decarboxylase/phosphopantothenate--cysteine ligase CoaBC [Methylomirabilota bacterium]|nr:bifunctional phosphopantothenoylcysteine decarboxylase/phosphopantothenate--cysteine ligase CoaBC [Methylomirabilota bacterium]